MAIKRTHAAIGGASVACLALCAQVVTGFEGERLKTYRDIVGVPTYCIGETRGAVMGQTYTHEQCQAILTGRLKEFDAGVSSCVKVPLSDDRRAASISLAYNIGIAGFCRSSFVTALNAGDPRACDRIMAWDHAGGRVVEGLRRRREAERQLCIANK